MSLKSILIGSVHLLFEAFVLLVLLGISLLDPLLLNSAHLQGQIVYLFGSSSFEFRVSDNLGILQTNYKINGLTTK